MYSSRAKNTPSKTTRLNHHPEKPIVIFPPKVYTTNKDVNPELRQFLNYVAGRKSKDPFVRKLDDAVREAKKNRKWRHEYMTLLMRDQENVEKGFELGLEQGRELGLEQGENGIIIRLYDHGLPVDQIANFTGKDIGKIREVIKNRSQEK